MPTFPSRRFSPEFKLRVMERLRAGEVLSAVAEEIGVRRQLLYKWRDALRFSRRAIKSPSKLWIMAVKNGAGLIPSSRSG